MAEALLRCNVQTCRKRLEEQAVATSCSHIFCMEHGQEVIGGQNCLACGTKCKSKYDYAVNNLQPPDQYKSILLNGLNPEHILEIASRSISFYTYQLGQENDMKDQLIRKGSEERDEMQSYCNTVAANCKAELEKLKKVAHGLRKELEEKIRETEKQREFISNCSRINKKLQLQLVSCKRQVVDLKGRSAAGGGFSPQFTAMRGQNDGGSLPFNFGGEPGPPAPRHPFAGNLFGNNELAGTFWPNARHSH